MSTNRILGVRSSIGNRRLTQMRQSMQQQAGAGGNNSILATAPVSARLAKLMTNTHVVHVPTPVRSVAGSNCGSPGAEWWVAPRDGGGGGVSRWRGAAICC